MQIFYGSERRELEDWIYVCFVALIVVLALDARFCIFGLVVL